MRMNRKAVTDLPIKLLIISVILAISVPIVFGSLDSSRDGMDRTQMENESQRIAGAAASTYYSALGDGRYIEVDVPEGCTIILGGDGEDAYGIHMYRGSERVSTHWMEKPCIPFIGETIVEGKAIIHMSSESGGIRTGTA